ncbi:hypothetical protein CONPUDRAFT_155816 [Coniophora puteana RWD-64-598 SS2]|uniref:Uncharacterized protein n=1 Tax=Coniophora puteana (strain RWD-64-598) TaxID=741705 RepID=A0A5M3MJB2_CONPW|nr:uncharacterized protein CONPUDRAFT_155816 [Coniophora puteana RWD-64-598 SS2]EIW79136.1 hypothetical protein CONPUDRAFT_155816 [Coniophora puteana RWD-64-598 SS2]
MSNVIGLVKCPCRSFGCGSDPQGYREQQPKIKQQHQKADELHDALDAHTAQQATQGAAQNTQPEPLNRQGKDMGWELPPGNDRLDVEDIMNVGQVFVQELFNMYGLQEEAHNQSLNNEGNEELSNNDNFFTRQMRAHTPPPNINSENEDQGKDKEELVQPKEPINQAQQALKDTLYAPMDDLFDYSDVHDQDVRHNQQPLTFSAHPSICNTYIRVFTLCDGVSHTAA